MGVEVQQQGVEVGIGEMLVDFVNMFVVDVEMQQVQGDIDLVCVVEGFYQGFGGGVVVGEFVMLDDYGVDFVVLVLQFVFVQIVVGELC